MSTVLQAKARLKAFGLMGDVAKQAFAAGAAARKNARSRSPQTDPSFKALGHPQLEADWLKGYDSNGSGGWCASSSASLNDYDNLARLLRQAGYQVRNEGTTLSVYERPEDNVCCVAFEEEYSRKMGKPVSVVPKGTHPWYDLTIGTP